MDRVQPFVYLTEPGFLQFDFVAFRGSLNCGWIHPSTMSPLEHNAYWSNKDKECDPAFPPAENWLQLNAGRIWLQVLLVWGKVGGRQGDTRTQRQNDLIILNKPNKKQLKKKAKKCYMQWNQYKCFHRFNPREILLNWIGVSVLLLLPWMILQPPAAMILPLPWAEFNLPLCRQLTPRRHGDILGTAKTALGARGRIIICWINETRVKLSSPSNTLLLHVSEEMEVFLDKYRGVIYIPLLPLYAPGWSHLHGNTKWMQ